MFECLRKKLTHTPAYPHFLSLLQHALLLPRESLKILKYNKHKYWFFFSLKSWLRLPPLPLANVRSHSTATGPPGRIGRRRRRHSSRDQRQRDSSVVSLKPICCAENCLLQMVKSFLFTTSRYRLATEQELLAARAKAEEFEKENCDLVHTLTLKEQELDLRVQEKVSFTHFLLR